MPLLFDNSKPEKNWSIVQSRFSVKKNMHYESLFTIGSGYLNVRASLPEGLANDEQNISFMRRPGNVTLEHFQQSKSKWGTYIPGFMEQHPLLNEEMINLPFVLGLHVAADGEKLDMEQSKVHKYIRWLDLRDGCVHRTLEWHTKSGSVISVAFHSYVHMVLRQIICQNVTVTVVDGTAKITVNPFLDSDVRTNGYDHFAKSKTWHKQQKKSGQIGIIVSTHENKSVAAVSRITGLQKCRARSSQRMIELMSSHSLSKGETISINKTTAISTSIDSTNPAVDAKKILTAAAKKSAGDLYSEHRARWDELWSKMDIDIQRDKETTLTLRFAMFHMTRSNPQNPRAAICAKMNGGDAYWGRIHWDNEVFIAPFFIYAFPELARPLLEYRVQTLPGAKSRAKMNDYPGAMFAWESGTEGKEECPSFQYADHEVHVSSDVVLGLWHYYCATEDINFIESGAAEVILEVARFWTARVDYLPNSDNAHILCVMGPDEYSHSANDNSYTNYLTSTALSIAADIYKMSKNNNKILTLINKLGITNKEVKQWNKISDDLFIPYDEQRSLVLQSSDFEDKAPIDFDSLWSDRTKPLGMFVSQEKLYRSRALKQADVLMLMQLFPDAFTKAEVTNALEYYEPITTHDSSLSVATHCIISAWLGLKDKAWEYFIRTRETDLGKGLHNSGEGIHSANAGALWQCVVFGFLGIVPAYLSDELSINPHLPDKWESCKVNLVWHGIRVTITVHRDRIEILTDKRLKISINGKSKWYEAEKLYSYKLK